MDARRLEMKLESETTRKTRERLLEEARLDAVLNRNQSEPELIPIIAKEFCPTCKTITEDGRCPCRVMGRCKPGIPRNHLPW